MSIVRDSAITVVASGRPHKTTPQSVGAAQKCRHASPATYLPTGSATISSTVARRTERAYLAPAHERLAESRKRPIAGTDECPRMRSLAFLLVACTSVPTTSTQDPPTPPDDDPPPP